MNTVEIADYLYKSACTQCNKKPCQCYDNISNKYDSFAANLIVSSFRCIFQL